MPSDVVTRRRSKRFSFWGNPGIQLGRNVARSGTATCHSSTRAIVVFIGRTLTRTAAAATQLKLDAERCVRGRGDLPRSAARISFAVRPGPWKDSRRSQESETVRTLFVA